MHAAPIDAAPPSQNGCDLFARGAFAACAARWAMAAGAELSGVDDASRKDGDVVVASPERLIA